MAAPRGSFFAVPPLLASFRPSTSTRSNNSFYAEQTINQSQIVNINNSGANSNINAVLLSSLTPS
jgi:hypothetical protein